MNRLILALSLCLFALALAVRTGLATPLMPFPLSGAPENAAPPCKMAQRAICRVV